MKSSANAVRWIEDRPKGRGAVRNVAGRFERFQVTPFDDGWGTLDEPAPALRTVVTPEVTRSIMARNDSPDIPFSRSINPYKGCEHGCVYCFARPTHAYLDLSPGLDFESRIFSKPDAARLLRKTLSRKGYVPKTIALGSNTDPYQPAERRLKITRGIVEVLAEFKHPVAIVTKSNLVLRDLDLLEPMARDGLVTVYVSVTTLDRTLARRMEPRAATPDRRLQTIRALSEAGVPAGVMASPMIPGLNDTELEAILEAAADAGAGYANYILLRLPNEVKQLFVDWLRANYPTKMEKVLNTLRQMRGGRLNDPRFGQRMRGSGAYADLLDRRFEVICRRLGLNREQAERAVDRFEAPQAAGFQGSLFA